MDRIKSILTAAAILGALSASTAFAQQAGTVNMRTVGSGSYFDWQQKLRNGRTEWQTYKIHAEKARQRNEAWPKPFECHDRQVYFATFYPMYKRGYEIESTLTDAHFKKDTNELSSAGKRKIAGIMQNLPVKRREIFIFETGDSEKTQARVANVRVAIDQWFGHLGTPKIATTTNPAYYQSGVEVQQFNTNFLSSLPTPGISSGSSSGGNGGGN